MSCRAPTRLDHPAARWWFVDAVWLTIRPNEPHSWHRPSKPSARRMSHPILANPTISPKEPSSFFEGRPPGANDVDSSPPHGWPPGKTMSYRSPPHGWPPTDIRLPASVPTRCRSPDAPPGPMDRAFERIKRLKTSAGDMRRRVECDVPFGSCRFGEAPTGRTRRCFERGCSTFNSRLSTLAFVYRLSTAS
jgi:hypothetical protein